VTLLEILPALYRPLLPEFFAAQAPPEEKATCGSCAMCAPPGTPPGAAGSYFRPDTKCCTYHPRLPNYLVGGLLADDRADVAEGRRRVQQVIASGIGVTPRWVAPPRKTRVIYHAARRNSFGRSLALRCPYYQAEGGLCTIWRWRETDCSTFFCKYSGGADGQTFWRSLNGYLHELQARLGEAAVAAVAPELEEPQVERGELTLEDLEDRPPDGYAAFWGRWRGREEDFYRACHAHVAGLDRAALEAIAGTEGRDRLERVVENYRQLAEPRLPERLVLDPDLATREIPAGLMVSTYCDYDPMVLSPALHEVLGQFSAAETVAETRARLLAEDGTEIPDDVMVTLHQMRVLVEPDRAGDRGAQSGEGSGSEG
jgi:Fe-S-cluster containining protein